ncbi:hypothetical protein BM221_003363 [Beauveria bassiana]|uniref:Uncharacterized protein n=1 Tax=Beauveria bassiana TaxID=176275 RepID=A0A2N6NUF8_BEABA|nr:hypothetical protein BM221_003363 [Beauveria bassiana]
MLNQFRTLVETLAGPAAHIESFTDEAGEKIRLTRQQRLRDDRVSHPTSSNRSQGGLPSLVPLSWAFFDASARSLTVDDVDLDTLPRDLPYP